jgi:peptidoglycan/LPS O-acetylase OafA/YrhL
MFQMDAPTRTARKRLLENLTRPNIPGLDGLRGIAALSVVAFHGWSERFPGRMAVEVFFVISGFLITWLLLREEKRSAAIDLKAFYLRRAFRLFPALFGLLVWEWLTDFPHVSKAGLISAAFYYGNYHLIHHGDMLGIVQTWSLAVEEHFYLVWPQVFIMLRNRRLLMYACFTFATVEFMARIVCATQVSFQYAIFATETNSSAILVGCGIALLLWYHPTKFPTLFFSPVIGAVSVVGLLATAQIPERPQLLWGITVAIPLAVVVVLQAATYEWRVLENPVARFLGRISYGIYLWGIVAKAVIHWLGHGVNLGHALLFPTVIALASASYYLIERPLQSLTRSWLKARHDRLAVAARCVGRHESESGQSLCR